LKNARIDQLNNDWLSEHEEIELKRRMFNEIQNNAKNLSAREQLFLKILSGVILTAAASLVAAVFLALAIEVLRGIFT
jgi:hypothetical protein